MRALHFALIDSTRRFSERDLYTLRAALEVNARHCAEAWNLRVPGVDVIHDVAHLPGWMAPVVFTDGHEAGTLAAHTYDILRGTPAARVYAPAASGLTTGSHSILESAGHEILEALVDPMVNRWADRPGHEGQQIPIEVCDPTQDTYPCVVRNVTMHVANFVLPRWFDVNLVDDDRRMDYWSLGGRFDYASRMTRPGELANSGYTVVREPAHGGIGWRTWAEHGNKEPRDSHQLAGNQHPWSRTRKRGAQLQP
jgi:hypothetical protein